MAEVVSDEAVGDDWAAALSEQNRAAGQVESEPQAEPRAGNPAVFEQFDGAGARAQTRNDIDLVLDIPVQLTVELGRTKLPIRNLLQLAQGSVVELDGLAGEPMDVLVNGCLVAQGEVVVVNEKFGIRLTDVITPSERIKRLNK
jgi:flagellar motor switch protein FliN/FliY